MFELTWPWAFLLLPLPLLIWFVCPRVRVPLPVALKIPFFNDMTGLVEQEKHAFTKQTHVMLFFLIWSLLTLALANPRWVGEPLPLARDGHNVMLVLDLSPSMAVNDMRLHGRAATRLSVVKLAARAFVKNRPSDRLGLILFGEQAYLQTPLTYDHANVLLRIADATAGLAGKSTSIGDALGLAVKHLQQVPQAGRVIILLTDGANNSGLLAPMKAAELAQNAGIKVYTIGLGSDTDTQTFNGLFLSMNAAAELDEDTLKAVAKKTGGRYFRSTNLSSLQAIYQAINRMETVTQSDATVRPQHDYYAWPLGLAFILLMYSLGSGSGLWRRGAPS